jgi:mevalonate kinase
MELLKLKSFFARLESFFHGKSSGLDPMVSFLNKAVLILDNDKLQTFNADFISDSGKGGVFLIDSGKPGETQPLVKHFRKMHENQNFRRVFDTYFVPLVNDSIHSYISGTTPALLENLKKLSGFQLKEFGKMIPDSVKETWQNGLESNRYYLKLCGSGGGGMMLGFTADIEQVQKELAHKSPIVIHRF